MAGLKSTHLVEGVAVEVYDLGHESFAARVAPQGIEPAFAAEFDPEELIAPLREGVVLDPEDEGIPYTWPPLHVQFAMLHAIKERRYQSGLNP